jgi:hypothetical protein
MSHSPTHISFRYRGPPNPGTRRFARANHCSRPGREASAGIPSLLTNEVVMIRRFVCLAVIIVMAFILINGIWGRNKFDSLENRLEKVIILKSVQMSSQW